MDSPSPADASDRSLRRMVADLAQLREEDQEAVLAELDDDEQRRVRSLLREFAADGRATPHSAARARLHGVSDWLDARLAGPDAARPKPTYGLWPRRRPPARIAPFSMTPRALAELRACADDLAGGVAAPPESAPLSLDRPAAGPQPQGFGAWAALLNRGGR